MLLNRLLPILPFALLFTAVSTLTHAAESSSQEIVDKAIDRSESQLKGNLEAEFESLVLSLIDSVDGEGTVTKSEKARYSRYPVDGAVFDELIEKEGRPLTEKETRKEKERRDEFIEEVKERLAEGKSPQPEDARQVRFNRDFMSRYETKLVGEENVRSYFCWVVYFEPKEGKLPVKNRMDEALNRSTGRIWISQDDYGLVRVEFEMREPIRYLAGILATVRNTVGRLEFERIEADIWFPVDFELKLDLRILFKNIRRNITMNWSDYHRAIGNEIPRLSSQGIVSR